MYSNRFEFRRISVYAAALLAVFGSILPERAQSQDIAVTATVDRARIGLNQQFELTVEISGSDAMQASQPELPDMKAFAAYNGSSSSQNIQFINGQMSATKSFTYFFMAKKTGRFTIAPVTVRQGGKAYKSAPIEIEIGKGSGSPAAPAPPRNGRSSRNSTGAADLSERLFLRAVPSKKRVYQNEPVIVEYKLYTRVQVTNYAFSNQPNYGDFWAESFPGYKQPRVQNEMLDGVGYKVATVRKVALFPTSAGRKVIPSLDMEASVRVRERRARRDIFDAFFDDPFFGRNIPYNLSSDTLAIDVLPLPQENRPASFTGAVGDFAISATVDKSEVDANEAITFKIKISGSGNIRILNLPRVQFPDVFEVYDPEESEQINRANDKISGVKAFTYLLIPRRAGTYQIPAVEFSYFSPEKGKYITVATEAIPVKVVKSDKVVSLTGSGFSKEEVELLGKDIRYIEKYPGKFSEIGRLFYHRPAFWVGVFAPLLLLLSAFTYRSHQERLSSNIAYARSRKAQKAAQKQLRNARQAMDRGDVPGFYAEVASALTKFVGNKLNLEDAALVTDEITAKLRQRGVDAGAVESYQQLLQECDFRRFASQQAPASEMKTFYETVRNLIADLEKAL